MRPSIFAMMIVLSRMNNVRPLTSESLLRQYSRVDNNQIDQSLGLNIHIVVVSRRQDLPICGSFGSLNLILDIKLWISVFFRVGILVLILCAIRRWRPELSYALYLYIINMSFVELLNCSVGTCILCIYNCLCYAEIWICMCR